MATTMRRTNRTATPARWQAALGRAIAEGVQVRQLAGSGAWVATSGSDAGAAYALAVTGGVAHGCDCLAGLNGDPVCKHRAAFYAAVGLLDPEPPTPAAPAVVPCPECHGEGSRRMYTGGRLSDGIAVPCRCRRETEAPDPSPCPACDGRGWAWAGSGLEAEQFPISCLVCGGTGLGQDGEEADGPAGADDRDAASDLPAAA